MKVTRVITPSLWARARIAAPDLAVPHDEEVRVRTNSEHRNGGVEEQPVILDWRQPADDSHQRHSGIESEFAAKRAALLPAAEQRHQVEPGLDDADVVG